ncbi:MAG: hypothetical protein R2748_16595 [Bryobacterales bacterium]
MQFNRYPGEVARQVSLAESNKTQDPFNRAGWSRSSWNIRQVLVFVRASVRSCQFGGNWHKGVDMVLGGWSLEASRAWTAAAVPGQRRT